MNDANVILLGASTRAMATSARRAGWTPWCADLFADADLQRIAAVRKVASAAYPQGLLDALVGAPQAPVIYTGGLENWPDVVGQIDRPLWGNAPAVLRAIRTPRRWTQCLQERGLPCPALCLETPTSGRWLLKPRQSAAGFGIRLYAGQPFNPRTHFLQEWIDGDSCSAVFLGREDDAILLGVTQQLIGTPWLNTHGFHYAGNLGPLTMDAAQESRWRVLGVELAKAFHPRGLFGIDAIVRAGVPWPIEINPRYTASLELLERSYHTALLPLHRAVFDETPLPLVRWPTPPAVWGKAILYARQRLAFPAAGPWLEALAAGVNLDETDYADIPHAGEIIEQGHPVMTVFASAPTTSECLAKLHEKAQALDRRLCG
jgi:predicted ATP-grasp superfamily ATP-dependent carboligase